MSFALPLAPDKLKKLARGKIEQEKWNDFDDRK
jgi:hypothetical protein